MAKTSIQYIKEAARKLVDSKLQRLGAAKTQEIFQGVMQTVGLSTLEEVYLFVAQFDLSCKDQSSNMDDLARYFACSSLDMVEYVPALKSLESKGYLIRRGRRDGNILRQNFSVSDTTMAAVIDNEPVTARRVEVSNVEMDKYEFCKAIAEKAEDDEVVTDDLTLFVEKQERNNPHLPLVENLKAKVPNILDRTLYYDICYDNFNRDGQGKSDISSTMRDICSNMHQRMSVRKSVMEGEHILLKLGLCELEGEDEIGLTDEGKEFFYGEDLNAFAGSLKCKDIYDFLENVHDFFHDRNKYDSNEQGSVFRLGRYLLKYEEANRHLPYIQRISRFVQDVFDRVLIYTIGYDLTENGTTSLTYEVSRIYSRRSRRRVMNDFKDNRHTLQKQEMVEIEKTSSLFGENINLALTDKGKEMLFGEDAELYINDVSEKDLLPCDKITEKTLFFSENLTEQLTLLRNSLSQEYYQDFCARLESNKLPKGIAVLLYGEPGTGKTESVMQIARATGRGVMHVDISATKTCWFGESEKLIKKVFTDYRRLCEKRKVKPILLFNEADAIFSKRKDVGSGSVAQTENAIQNIILEEMEKLDGILIATTNLADNLDGAFERRFLFKIRFDKPTMEAKTNIWKNKLPILSSEGANTLASTYELSGGQIDNIVRKAMMQEVIRGEKPTLDSLKILCNEEKLSKKGMKRIGFC